ncbi:hypothetical protein PCANC_09455 [Puccinia coronata f. sp. avenae]|uniref:Uncharacterized protein n=1 Tax=Puccinia coronata f. sp. avenae TaxID=200324 RepID=A0A2N5SUG2_9BASI|nr:hypothetical protein PCANC_09455 [Puccinia coronata f. sp. avenae]
MVGRGWTHQDASDQVDVHKWYIQAQRMTQVLRASHSSRAQHKPPPSRSRVLQPEPGWRELAKRPSPCDGGSLHEASPARVLS